MENQSAEHPFRRECDSEAQRYHARMAHHAGRAPSRPATNRPPGAASRRGCGRKVFVTNQADDLFLPVLGDLCSAEVPIKHAAGRAQRHPLHIVMRGQKEVAIAALLQGPIRERYRVPGADAR